MVVVLFAPSVTVVVVVVGVVDVVAAVGDIASGTVDRLQDVKSKL